MIVLMGVLLYGIHTYRLQQHLGRERFAFQIASETQEEVRKHIARDFHVSETVIGLTLVAVGTSLPELATTITAAFRRETDVALGNVIGSNVFNLLVVLGLPGLIAPFTLDESVFSRDFVAMIILSVLWFVMMLICVKRGKPFGKLMGVILLLGYFAYYWVLFQQG